MPITPDTDSWLHREYRVVTIVAIYINVVYVFIQLLQL